jgi:hypothetical protein
MKMSRHSKVVRSARRDLLRRWERKFNRLLKEADAQEAWRELTNQRCNAAALKSSLYYAACGLESAQDFPREFTAFIRAREATLIQLTQLRRTLQTLIAPNVLRTPVVSHLSSLWGVRKKYRHLFTEFPERLKQFENILKTIDPPRRERIDIERDSEIARTEALLHIYVKETTGKFFTERTAVLLQSGAQSYGLDQLPSYSADAVNRRYRRWSRKNGDDHAQLTDLVRNIRRDGDNFLENFLDARKIQVSLAFSGYQILQQLVTNESDRRTNSRMTDPLGWLPRS